jgi:hypothetical protein
MKPNLDKAREARVARIAAGLGANRTAIQKAMENPKSLRMSINAKCYECQGGTVDSPPDPGWQWGIGNCTVKLCSLLSVRPYQKKLGQPVEGVYRI